MQSNTQTTTRTSDEGTWAAACHLSGLVVWLGAPALAHILVPLVIWLVGRTGRPFVDEQGKEAVNFQISLTFYAIAASIIAIPLAIILAVSIVGIPVLILLAFLAVPIVITFIIAGTVLAIIAAYHASNGEHYRYPLTIRFIS